MDTGVDAAVDAGLAPIIPLACPQAGDPDPIQLDAPGRWRLERCSGAVRFSFTVPPRTAWHIDATSDAPVAPDVLPPGGHNPGDAPQEVAGFIILTGEFDTTLTIRWVECFAADSCGVDRYCADAACVSCADGDEVFDTRTAEAPRTDAMPRALFDERVSGIVCPGFDDWFTVEQPANQPLFVRGAPEFAAYLADPAATRLADLEHLEVRERTVIPSVEDRTVWLRITTPDVTQSYGLRVTGCQESDQCGPWFFCSRAEDERACEPCEGEHDVHGDDDLSRSPEAAPIPLVADDPLMGTVCGADEDWYAIEVGVPASRVEIEGARGEAHPAGVRRVERGRPVALDSGDVMVLRVGERADLNEAELIPGVVWVRVVSDRGPHITRPYTISVTNGAFCTGRPGQCAAGATCDRNTNRCVEGCEGSWDCPYGSHCANGQCALGCASDDNRCDGIRERCLDRDDPPGGLCRECDTPDGNDVFRYRSGERAADDFEALPLDVDVPGRLCSALDQDFYFIDVPANHRLDLDVTVGDGSRTFRYQLRRLPGAGAGGPGLADLQRLDDLARGAEGGPQSGRVAEGPFPNDETVVVRVFDEIVDQIRQLDYSPVDYTLRATLTPMQ